MSRAEGTPHPLLQAGRALVSDLLSTLLFVALFAITRNVVLATVAAIALGLGQIGWLAWRGAAIDLMQWLSLFLVVALGSVTLLTRDPRFVLLKPTLIYGAFGLVMLRRGWMNRYAAPVVREHGGDLLVLFGFCWAALMFATAGGNLAMAWLAGTAAWVWFITLFPAGSKIALFGVQYLVMKRVIGRRIRRPVPVQGKAIVL